MLAIGLIEDDEKLRKMVLDYFSLQSEFYIAFSLSNIDDIVDALFPPDIILLDIHLHGNNSLQRIGYIKGIFPEANIIVMTGEYKEEAMLDAIKMGAASFINKPFSMKSLIQLINYTIKNSQYQESEITIPHPKVLRPIQSQINLNKEYKISENEGEIIQLLWQGVLDREIATKLNVGVPIINTQIRNICVKMGVENKKQLIEKINTLR